ncbi:MAG: immunoglobulin domain-containing protein [Planctomycetes bacterium]|nr:immunoglobulin domain-containing protein [Planctomycetota bacterium]
MLRRMLGLIAFGALSLPAAHAQYSEVEPNETRALAIAAGAFVMSAGSTITGVTTGTTSTPGAPNSADVHLIELAPLPLGIYRHRLTIGSANPRQTMSLLISDYGATVPDSTSLAGIFASAAVPQYSWYGFGDSERILIRVTGVTSTSNPLLTSSAPYVLTLQSTPVAAQAVPGTFAPGQITLSAVGLSTVDSEIHVFDAALREIFDYQNDDQYGAPLNVPHFVRPYAAGVYYIAIGRFNLISSYPSASGIANDPLHYYPGSLGGEDYRERDILPYPGSILSTFTNTTISPVPFSVTDATAQSVSVAAAVGWREIAWYRMQVGSTCTAPSITSSPTNLEACYGNSVSLTATATGTEPLSYQWYWNGSPIPVVGQAATLSIPVVDFSYAGSYTCTVTNACGSATTTPALLHVHPAGPEITQQPAPQTLCVGEMASFTVAATGRMHSGLEYQWLKDGNPILGATSATLSFVVSGLADGGSYLCRVNEPGCGSADSDAAALTVRNAAPTIALVGDAIVNLECGHDSYVELGASVSDDCDQGLLATIGGDTVDPHQLGHYVVTYDAVDSLGNPAVRVERHVFVVDTEPPVLQASVATSVLWSPQHELVNVGLAVQASDHCTPQAAVENVSVQVWCDEIELPDTGDGTGRHSPDAKDIGAGTLRLRSERRGSSDGRIYVLVVRTQDASGNAAYAFPTVVCPSNQNQTALSVVQTQALSVTAQLIAVAGTTERAEDLESTLASLGFRKHGLEAENGPHQ